MFDYKKTMRWWLRILHEDTSKLFTSSLEILFRVFWFTLPLNLQQPKRDQRNISKCVIQRTTLHGDKTEPFIDCGYYKLSDKLKKIFQKNLILHLIYREIGISVFSTITNPGQFANAIMAGSFFWNDSQGAKIWNA